MSNIGTSVILLSGTQDLGIEEAMILEMMSEDENAFEFSPAKIRIAPGGLGQFDLAGDMKPKFTAVVPISQRVRAFWPSRESRIPVCASPDGVTGYYRPEADDEQGTWLQQMEETFTPLGEGFSCAHCPFNEWGSGNRGTGKACQERRRLLVIPEGWTAPAIFSLPPTSVRAWDKFASGLRSRRSAYFAVRIRFELDSAESAQGDPYNVIRPSVVGNLSPEEIEAVGKIRKAFGELVREMPIESDLVEEEATE